MPKDAMRIAVVGGGSVTRVRDILADLTRRLETEMFTHLLRNIHEGDPLSFKSNQEVATELFRITGVMPYLGDRHTCEFFSSYITSHENSRRAFIISFRIGALRDSRQKLSGRTYEHCVQD